ncbi:SSS family transporter [Herbihabitans rhizosphaerae]|uniref:SSS family transporter n=1 Tax=Herbihabitans rhizosphaerae TaxID=1872711 RepID=A0A4Q7KRZ1_9PSEU|nr:sodium:solute symporter [Herbihabitans rhizosphaerae]RZS39335.1 SSS family transporter [Herbihabitans rhizosphaerae]
MRTLDVVIILIFLVGMPLLGVLIGGKQKSGNDYFVSDKGIKWWVVCLSVVSAETSTLTVLSVPTISYLAKPEAGGMTYLTLALGYIVGRIVVAFILLPKYVAGDLVTAYAFLGKRFGNGMQATTSATFQITRLLADAIRLFATAIPIKLVLKAYGIDASYWAIIIVLGIALVFYTSMGGVRAVVWVDAIQMLWYLLGAVAVIWVLTDRLPDGWFDKAVDANKFQIFDFSSNWLTATYAFLPAFFGGAVFAMASHGTDQLIVQRLMSTRNVRAGQKALIASGVVVFFQFALFLFIGAMLSAFYNNATPTAPKDKGGLGLGANDELFGNFIVTEMPSGLSGFVIAGILAAALSSSLGALASASVTDIWEKVVKRPLTDQERLRMGRIWTMIWAGLTIIVAGAFAQFNAKTSDPIVIQALGIASYTYGALLGAFLLGLIIKKARQADAVVAFLVTVVVMAYVILGVKFVGTVPLDPKAPLPPWDHIEWFNFSKADAKKNVNSLVSWWNVPLGVIITLAVGGLMSLRHKDDEPETEEATAAKAT